MIQPDAAWAAYQHFVKKGNVDAAMFVVSLFGLDPGGAGSDVFEPVHTMEIIHAVSNALAVRDSVTNAYATRRLNAAQIASDSGAPLEAVDRAMRLIEGRRAAI